jgi:hypothetical protein
MPLSNFLVKAKTNTYASNGEGGERTLEDGAKELIYEQDEYKYRDRYFGSNFFIGEEIVWQNGKAVWGMNYYGKIVSDKVDNDRLYPFLKKALMLVKTDRPFRGPDDFSDGDWKYHDESNGTVDKFDGTETIYFKKEKVFELKYHGGTVVK